MRALRAGLVLIALTAAGAASAAEPPPVPPPAPVYRGPVYDGAPVYRGPMYYDWSGFYIGGHAGWAWADKTWRDNITGLNLGSYVASGFIGGVQGGYNWQASYWVFGLELQSSWGGFGGGVNWVDPTDAAAPLKRTDATIQHLGTVALRVGHAWDRSLFYAKVGAGWVYEVYGLFDTAAATTLASASVTRGGWMLGAGFEYGVFGNWTAKIEYDYLAFGTERTLFTGATTRPFEVTQHISLVKLGINYRFAWPF